MTDEKCDVFLRNHQKLSLDTLGDRRRSGVPKQLLRVSGPRIASSYLPASNQVLRHLTKRVHQLRMRLLHLNQFSFSTRP